MMKRWKWERYTDNAYFELLYWNRLIICLTVNNIYLEECDNELCWAAVSLQVNDLTEACDKDCVEQETAQAQSELRLTITILD